MRRLQTAESESDLLAVNAAEKIDLLQEAIETVIKGKPEAVRLAIVTLIAGGHLLIEDVPGVGKTTLAHCSRPGPGLYLSTHSVHFRLASVRRHRPFDF